MDEAITIGVNLAARGNPMLWSVDVLLQVVCHVRAGVTLPHCCWTGVSFRRHHRQP